MKKLITLLLLFNVWVSWSQDSQVQELGIGFVIAENSNQYEDGSIPSDIFADKNLKTKISGLSVSPFFMKPDYGLYHFICLNKTLDYYEVYINDKEKAFLPNNSQYYFKSWDALLFNSSVQRINRNNEIRKEAKDASSLIINACEIDQLQVLELREKNNEYWMFIRFSEKCDYDTTKDENMKYGWIKWRTQDKLLVNILLLC